MPVMDKAIYLKEKLYMVSEAQRARKEMRNILLVIDNCIDKSKKVLHQIKATRKMRILVVFTSFSSQQEKTWLIPHCPPWG